jgi:hypothetical protein
VPTGSGGPIGRPRWATPAEPDRAIFEGFLAGYQDAGGAIGSLAAADFAKWFAALLGWFSFQGRRALGDWPSDTTEERGDARAMAGSALATLRDGLASLPAWSRWA